MSADTRTSTPSPQCADVACSHCGLAVPTGLVEHGASEQFCCAGCRTAYAVIHSCGLDRYYALREKLEDREDRAPAQSTRARYAEFDDPAFAELYCRPAEPGAAPGHGLWSCELFLQCVHCAACVWLVERLPRVCDGVVESRLDLRRGMVRVVWDAERVNLSRIARALDSLGYPPHPARDANDRDLRRREDRRQLVRVGVAGACAGNVMLLGLALYAGLFDVMEPAYAALFRWASMGISVVSLAWPGSVFFRSAWAALRTRTMHLDVPIALALGAGGVWGVVNTLRGAGEIYFDSLSVLVFLLLVGRFIQHRQQRRSADSVEMLFSLTPTSALLVDEDPDGGPGYTREVSIQSLCAGQMVEVRAGASVPVDGVVVAGLSQVDQSLLTGESRAVTVETGDHVAAGTVNLASTIRVRVEATGAQTRIGRLMALVQDSLGRRAPIVRLADRIAGWFLAGMLGLAALTLGLWLALDPANPSLAVDHAVALLVVTCPCALGLATPLALTVSIGRAARRGILIKGGGVLQALASPGTMVLDKTGTLTVGRMRVVRTRLDRETRAAVCAIELHSTHPIARAIVEAFASADADEAADVAHTLGGGMEGTVRGRRLVIGSPTFIASRIGGLSDSDARAVADLTSAALTPVLVAEDGRIIGSIGLGDPLRQDSSGAVADLRSRGWNPVLLSGDHETVVAAAATDLGLPRASARGGATPEDKVGAVRDLSSSGATVVMVGDGVNDAAALAAATVGIAVHGGAEASLAAADVYLARPGLSPVLELCEGARRTMRTIRICLAASLCYNVAAASLCVAGLISPLIAAVVMPASSLTVLALCVRSGAFRSGRSS
ncbi:MAG: cadmium-translocating P-type ATPase [Phycisphaeraceae bacterium]|nr:cadmium-translocating P-type ATPase [Phycisphaeraceae bacterium]